MKKSIKQDIFVKQPIYEGGAKAMQTFIHQNLQYPKDAIEKSIEGVAELRITIDYEGLVTDVQILGSISPSCDKEAIRLAKLLKFTIPKNPRKLKVLFHKNIKVQFKLPNQEVKKIVNNKPQRIVYNYSSEGAPSEGVKPKNNQTVVYQYTINTSK
jgi:protein TonB